MFYCVLTGLEHNFNKYNDDFITDQNTPYDYESVMHYRPYSFNKNDSVPTITTNIPAFNNIIGQYLDLSTLDTLRLNRMYNCCENRETLYLFERLLGTSIKLHYVICVIMYLQYSIPILQRGMITELIQYD